VDDERGRALPGLLDVQIDPGALGERHAHHDAQSACSDRPGVLPTVGGGGGGGGGTIASGLDLDDNAAVLDFLEREG
jgi:hypothetical protein